MRRILFAAIVFPACRPSFACSCVVTVWRFQSATLDGNPVAVRITSLNRWNVQTTSDQFRLDQSRLEFDHRAFERKAKP